MSRDEINKQELLDSLVKDLNLDTDEHLAGGANTVKELLSPLLTMSVEKMTPQHFYDLSIMTASLGDWEQSQYWIQRAVPFFTDRELESVKVWEMRTFFELGRPAEVIALAGTFGAPKYLVKEFHYLLGEAFLELKMFDKARQRFEAVSRVDAKYRDVEIQMKSLSDKSR